MVKFEADSMIVYQPRYADDKKTRVHAIVRAPDGRITDMEADIKDKSNPFIRDVFLQYTVAEIEAFTARETEIRAERARIESDLEEDRRTAEEREIAFQAKTKALEIPEVKDCKDPRIARRIRKARSAYEVAGWIAVAFIQSLDAEERPAENS